MKFDDRDAAPDPSRINYNSFLFNHWLGAFERRHDPRGLEDFAGSGRFRFHEHAYGLDGFLFDELNVDVLGVSVSPGPV